jgi:hypothetical protein
MCVFESLINISVGEFVIMDWYKKAQIMSRYADGYRDALLTYPHQCRQLGPEHVLLT